MEQKELISVKADVMGKVLRSLKKLDALLYLRSARNATGLASATSESTTTPAVNFPATPATTPAATPNTRPTSSRARSFQPREQELVMNDEERVFPMVALPRCPCCHDFAHLHRDAARIMGLTKLRYRIECQSIVAHVAGSRSECWYWVTPWCDSSKEAAQVWTLTVKLST